MQQEINRDLENSYSHGMHFMVRLTYISRAVKDIDSKELTSIVEAARENNEKNGITGMLVFNRNFFLQTIEGSRVIINDLFNKLIDDKRHYDLQIVEVTEVDERSWSEWSMAYASPNIRNQSAFLRFSTGVNFNPYQMNASSINKLMKSLSKVNVACEEDQKIQKNGFFSKCKKLAG